MDNLFEQMANISKAHAYDIVSKQRDELLEENKRLSASNKELMELVRECYGYFSAPNFTDRYGTAERLKAAIQNNTK